MPPCRLHGHAAVRSPRQETTQPKHPHLLRADHAEACCQHAAQATGLAAAVEQATACCCGRTSGVPHCRSPDFSPANRTPVTSPTHPRTRVPPTACCPVHHSGRCRWGRVGHTLQLNQGKEHMMDAAAAAGAATLSMLLQASRAPYSLGAPTPCNSQNTGRNTTKGAARPSQWAPLHAGTWEWCCVGDRLAAAPPITQVCVKPTQKGAHEHGTRNPHTSGQPSSLERISLQRGGAGSSPPASPPNKIDT